MNKYENIINTLRCQINRAKEKKNLIKADKLKKKLSEVNNLHKMAQKKKLDENEPEQLVSLEAGNVGNQIGAKFWEQDQLLLLTNGSSSDNE